VVSVNHRRCDSVTRLEFPRLTASRRRLCFFLLAVSVAIRYRTTKHRRLRLAVKRKPVLGLSYLICEYLPVCFAFPWNFWEAGYLSGVLFLENPIDPHPGRLPGGAPVKSRAVLIAELLEHHAAALQWFASQWTTAAEDCVQESLVELARQETLPENPAAWLYRVVRNRALNAARAEHRRRGHEEDASMLYTARRQQEANRADALALAEAVDALEPAARELVILRVWSGLGWQEIAELVGTSSSTAQRHYVRALTELRMQLEPSCPKD